LARACRRVEPVVVVVADGVIDTARSIVARGV
jgi:hypothetical protein